MARWLPKGQPLGLKPQASKPCCQCLWLCCCCCCCCRASNMCTPSHGFHDDHEYQKGLPDPFLFFIFFFLIFFDLANRPQCDFDFYRMNFICVLFTDSHLNGHPCYRGGCLSQFVWPRQSPAQAQSSSPSPSPSPSRCGGEDIKYTMRPQGTI